MYTSLHAFFLKGKVLGVQWLNQMIDMRLPLLRNCQTGCTIFFWLYNFSLPPAVNMSFILRDLTVLGMDSLFNLSNSCEVVMVSNFSFNLELPHYLDYGRFMMSI